MDRCDEVFSVLTRGPFPTGEPSDAAVEEHLLECPSCRQLAEALRPADELTRETIPAEECASLPSYWGPRHSIEPRVLSAVLAEFDYSIAPQSAAAKHRPAAVKRVPRAARSIVVYLVAASLGVSLATLIYGVGMVVEQRRLIPTQMPAAETRSIESSSAESKPIEAQPASDVPSAIPQG